MSSIFLSHNSVDKPFVRKLANDLRRRGHYAWVDEAEIKVGDSLIDKIEEGIDNTDFLGVVISQNSIESEWVKREVRIALTQEISGKKVKVLPILLEKVKIPSFLIDKKYADFTSEDKYKNSLNEIFDAMEAVPNDGKTTMSPFEIQALQERLKAVQEELECTRGEKRRLVERLEKERKNIPEELKRHIESENEWHPEFADIDRLYAFMCGGTAVTAGYLLHALRKEHIKGSHPLAMLIEMYGKKDELALLLEATLIRLQKLESYTIL